MSEHDADAVVRRVTADLNRGTPEMYSPGCQKWEVIRVLSRLKPGDDLGSGLVAAPREPTEAMKLAGGMIPDGFKGTGAARGNADRIYRAMIAAAADSTTRKPEA